MKVVKLTISNFRGIKNSELIFDGHTLFIGSNNVGKSTLCEALDLVLSPDRLNRTPAIDEFDFHNSQYWQPPAVEGDKSTFIPLRIEVILVNPSASILAKCGGHLEFWHTEERRLIAEGEADLVKLPVSVPCLRACQIFCVNGVSVVNGESIAELNGKTSQRRFPVADRHRPFLADVA